MELQKIESNIKEIIGDVSRLKDLSLEEKHKIWEGIYLQVKELPEGTRVHIDDETLDELYFFKVKNKKGEIVKFPWPNIAVFNCIKYIDMSNVSFKGAFLDFDAVRRKLKFIKHHFDDKTLKKINKFFEFSHQTEFNPRSLKIPVPYWNFDYQYTNIDINFKELYFPSISRTSFKGIDLRSKNGEALLSIENCDLTETGIKFEISKMLLLDGGHFYIFPAFDSTKFDNNISLEDVLNAMVNCLELPEILSDNNFIEKHHSSTDHFSKYIQNEHRAFFENLFAKVGKDSINITISEEFQRKIEEYFKKRDSLYEEYNSGKISSAEFQYNMLLLEKEIPFDKYMSALRILIYLINEKRSMLKINEIEFIELDISEPRYKFRDIETRRYENERNIIEKIKNAFSKLGERFIAELFYGYGATDLRLTDSRSPLYLKYYKKAMSLQFGFCEPHKIPIVYDYINEKAKAPSKTNPGSSFWYHIDWDMTFYETALVVELCDIFYEKDLSLAFNGKDELYSKQYRQFPARMRLKFAESELAQLDDIQIKLSPILSTPTCDPRYFDDKFGPDFLRPSWEIYLNGKGTNFAITGMKKLSNYIEIYWESLNNAEVLKPQEKKGIEKILGILRLLAKDIDAGKLNNSSINGIVIKEGFKAEDIYRQVFPNFNEDFFDLIFRSEDILSKQSAGFSK